MIFVKPYTKSFVTQIKARPTMQNSASSPGSWATLTSPSTRSEHARPRSVDQLRTAAVRAATADALVQATAPFKSAAIPTIVLTRTPTPSSLTIDAVRDEVDDIIATFSPDMLHAVRAFGEISNLPIVEPWELVRHAPAPLNLTHKKQNGVRPPVVKHFGALDPPAELLQSPAKPQRQSGGQGTLSTKDSAIELPALPHLTGQMAEGVSIEDESGEASDFVDFFKSLVGSDGEIRDKRTSLRAFR